MKRLQPPGRGKTERGHWVRVRAKQAVRAPAKLSKVCYMAPVPTKKQDGRGKAGTQGLGQQEPRPPGSGELRVAMQVGGVSHCSWARLRQAGTHAEKRQIAKVHAHTHARTHRHTHTQRESRLSDGERDLGERWELRAPCGVHKIKVKTRASGLGFI